MWREMDNHTTAREPKRAHLRVPAFNHTTKIQRNDPQERKKMKIVAGEEKKNAKFWTSHPSGPHPLDPLPPFGAQQSGAPPFGAPKLRDTNLRGPSAGPPPDRPKFRPFFPLPLPFSLFFSLEGRFVEFGCFEVSVPTVHVWAHGLSCETPAAFAKCQEQFYNC